MLYYTGFFGEKSRESLEEQVFSGEVIQIFDNTINIVLKKQFPNLLTIGGMQVLGNPQSIAFDNFPSLKRQLNVGDTCFIQFGKQLVFSHFTCQIEDTDEFRLIQGVGDFDFEGFIRKKAFLESKLTEKNQHQQRPGIAPFYQQLAQDAAQLAYAILTENWLKVETHIRRMIGLGIGLTPSGDDFLTGMLLVLFDESNLKSIVLEALSQTNLISQHQLYFASQGFASPSVLTVIQEIFNQQSELVTLEKAIEEALAIGSTSGHDLLSGIVAGLQVLERKGEEENECSSKSHSQSLR